MALHDGFALAGVEVGDGVPNDDPPPKSLVWPLSAYGGGAELTEEESWKLMLLVEDTILPTGDLSTNSKEINHKQVTDREEFGQSKRA